MKVVAFVYKTIAAKTQFKINQVEINFKIYFQKAVTFKLVYKTSCYKNTTIILKTTSK